MAWIYKGKPLRGSNLTFQKIQKSIIPRYKGMPVYAA